MPVEISNPDTVEKPTGLYSVMSRARGGGDLIYLCGMTGDIEGDTSGVDEFDLQCNDIYRKIGAALASAGGSFGNVLQFTTYLVDTADIPRFMKYRKRAFPRLFPNNVYPPNTLVVVSALVDEKYRIEVQTVAAI